MVLANHTAKVVKAVLREASLAVCLLWTGLVLALSDEQEGSRNFMVRDESASLPVIVSVDFNCPFPEDQLMASVVEQLHSFGLKRDLDPETINRDNGGLFVETHCHPALDAAGEVESYGARIDVSWFYVDTLRDTFVAPKIPLFTSSVSTGSRGTSQILAEVVRVCRNALNVYRQVNNPRD